MRGEKRREEKRREEDRREEKRREEKRIGEKRREQKRREETRRGEKRRGEERREERIGEEMEGCGGGVVREGWGEGWVDKETKKWDGVGVGPWGDGKGVVEVVGGWGDEMGANKCEEVGVEGVTLGYLLGVSGAIL